MNQVASELRQKGRRPIFPTQNNESATSLNKTLRYLQASRTRILPSRVTKPVVSHVENGTVRIVKPLCGPEN